MLDNQSPSCDENFPGAGPYGPSHNRPRAAGQMSAKERREEKTLQQLVGRVIQEYERAVDRGLDPSRALAGVLEWAACECQRIRR